MRNSLGELSSRICDFIGYVRLQPLQFTSRVFSGHDFAPITAIFFFLLFAPVVRSLDRSSELHERFCAAWLFFVGKWDKRRTGALAVPTGQSNVRFYYLLLFVRNVVRHTRNTKPVCKLFFFEHRQQCLWLLHEMIWPVAFCPKIVLDDLCKYWQRASNSPQ